MKNLLLILITIVLFTDSYAQDISKGDSVELVKVFDEFIYAIEQKDSNTVKELSLDTVRCLWCSFDRSKGMPPTGYKVSIDAFIDQSFKYLHTRQIIVSYHQMGVSIISHLDKSKENYMYHEVGVSVPIVMQSYNESLPELSSVGYFFGFEKVKGRYKFNMISTVP